MATCWSLPRPESLKLQLERARRTVGGRIYSPSDRPGQDLHNCHFQKRISGLQTIWHLGLGEEGKHRSCPELSAQGCFSPVARISVEVMQKRDHGWEKQILESVDTAGPGGPVTSRGHTHLGCTPIWTKPEARLKALSWQTSKIMPPLLPQQNVSLARELNIQVLQMESTMCYTCQKQKKGVLKNGQKMDRIGTRLL